MACFCGTISGLVVTLSEIVDVERRPRLACVGNINATKLVWIAF